MEVETKQIVVREIPVDLWRKFKQRAVAEDHTIQTAVTKAIELYLKSA
jgi:hypothetical protein